VLVFRDQFVIECFRILNATYPAFTGIGSALKGGRWTSPGRAAIYCGQTVSTCRLELLAHLVGDTKIPSHVVRRVSIPRSVVLEELEPDDLPSDWDHPTDSSVARAIGDVWFDDARSLGLIVPSVPADGDRNLIINETHPDFHKLIVSAPYPLKWDPRLFPLAR
jgi:RES domain-containing protein